MASLFGFEFRRRVPQEPVESFAPEVKDDGAVVVTATGGMYGTYLDLEGTARTEAELVTRYREMAIVSDIEMAVDEIVNETIIHETNDKVVEINLDDLNVGENIKNLIITEFNNIKQLLNFENQCYELFRKWYVDGRLYFHVIIDDKAPNLGIKELRYIDPRKIRKVREQKKKKDEKTLIPVTVTQNEYFLYNEKGYNSTTTGGGSTAPHSSSGIKIAKDSILHCTSGLLDSTGNLVLSHLHKAIKPLNQLRVMEDATVIYRIARAPERRIFYIDVGNLPKMKAEQYLKDIMSKHKNRLVYDSVTGELRDDRKFMTMLEDYWLPRREGNRGTEISTLPAGQNLGEIQDVEYFQKRLYRSLNVPVTRLMPEMTYSIGKSSEITRDEIKFTKFINRLRGKFSVLFSKCLEKQLVLKGIVSTDDWKVISQLIKFDYAKDNYYEELKESEVLNSRIVLATNIQPFLGKYFSHAWVRANIFKQSEEDVQLMDAQTAQEINNPILYPPDPLPDAPEPPKPTKPNKPK